MSKSPFSQTKTHFDFSLIMFLEVGTNIFGNVFLVCVFTVFTTNLHIFKFAQTIFDFFKVETDDLCCR